MKAVVQRVREARVDVDGVCVGQIGRGMLVLLGVRRGDARSDADYLADRIAGLRMFPDQLGKMNLSLRDTGGSLLVVSQFTLYGDCSRGRRPSFDDAAPAAEAKSLCDYFVTHARELGMLVETGIFQAAMDVTLVNEGPVTFVLESKQK